MPEPALDAVPDHGVPDRSAHDEPDPDGVRPVVGHDVDDEQGASAAASRTDDASDVSAMGEPMRRG